MEQFCIKQIVVKISKEVSRLIDALQDIYHDAGMRLTLQKEYIHKLIMTMVSPVSLKIEYDLSLFPYIIKPIKKPMPSFQQKQQQHLNNVQMMRNQSAQQFKNFQKKDKKRQQMPSDYNAIPNSTREMFNPNFDHQQLDHAMRSKNNGGVKAVLNFKHQKALVAWIKNERDAGRKVNRKAVQKKAIAICQRPDFKASWGWFRKFIMRNEEIKEMIYEYDPQFYDSHDLPSASPSQGDEQDKIWSRAQQSQANQSFLQGRNDLIKIQTTPRMSSKDQLQFRMESRNQSLMGENKGDFSRMEGKFSKQDFSKKPSKGYAHEEWNDSQNQSEVERYYRSQLYQYDGEEQNEPN